MKEFVRELFVVHHYLLPFSPTWMSPLNTSERCYKLYTSDILMVGICVCLGMCFTLSLQETISELIVIAGDEYFPLTPSEVFPLSYVTV